MFYIENCHNVTLQKVKKESSERELNDWGINLAIKNTAGESRDQGKGENEVMGKMKLKEN